MVYVTIDDVLAYFLRAFFKRVSGLAHIDYGLGCFVELRVEVRRGCKEQE